MRQYTIYCLTDPRTDAVHYVGKTCYGERPREHGRPSALARWPGQKSDWIRELHAAGMEYGVRILEGAGNNEDACEAERRWIAHGRANGWPLTNQTDGGDGIPGLIISDERRERIRAALTGKQRPPFSSEWRAKIAAAGTGRKMPPVTAAQRAARSKAQTGKTASAETRAKMSAARKGKTRHFAPEEIARLVAMSKARTGKPLSEEHRAKIGAAQVGRKMPPRSAEWRERHAAAIRGRPGHKQSPESIAKMIATRAARRLQRAHDDRG